MFNLLALPRASWKARVTFAALTAVTVGLMAQQWSGLHDDAAVSRWFAWLFMAGCALSLPRMLVVVILGRVPKVYAGFAGSAPTAEVDAAATAASRRNGSREL